MLGELSICCPREILSEERARLCRQTWPELLVPESDVLAPETVTEDRLRPAETASDFRMYATQHREQQLRRWTLCALGGSNRPHRHVDEPVDDGHLEVVEEQTVMSCA